MWWQVKLGSSFRVNTIISVAFWMMCGLLDGVFFYYLSLDSVDHNILLERLENWVGLSGMALKWFRSYLEGRGYYVSIGEHKSKWTSMTCGVPTRLNSCTALV